MNIPITLTLLDIFWFIVGVLAIVLLVYVIKLIKKLIETLSHVNVVLDDAKEISEVASRRTKQVDGMLDDVGETVDSVVSAVKGNQNVVKAVSSIVNTTASVVGMLKKRANTQTEEANRAQASKGGEK